MNRLLRSNPIVMGARRVSPSLLQSTRSLFIDSESTPNPHVSYVPYNKCMNEYIGDM